MTAGRPATRMDQAWQAAYRLGYPVACAWWALRRPRCRGALVCLRAGGAVLLVRQSYRRCWTLPGGGIHPGEAPEAAARRELLEELGLAASILHPAAVLHGNWDGRRDEVHIFELTLDQLPPLRLDNREVVAARLFTPVELPGLALSGPAAAYFAGCAQSMTASG